jgi:hypothetical protein
MALLPKSITNRAADTAAIKAPALNLTLGTGFLTFLTSAAVIFNKTFKSIFGFEPGKYPTITKALLISVVAAFAAIAVADIIGRAIASGPRDITHLAPAPKDWKAAIVQPGADDTGYLVAGIRFSTTDRLEYLLVKAGQAPIWKTQDEVKLALPST